MPRPVRSTLPLLICLALGLVAQTAQASGYRFGTQSAAAEGTANANAAEAVDASALFFNPAASSRLKGWHFSGVLDYVEPKSTFTDAGSYITLPGSGLQPRAISQPGDTSNPVKSAYVPHFYASYQDTEYLSFGMAVYVPWGTKLAYRDDWGGRYNMQSVELKSLAFNPSVAWKPAKDWSIGFGVSAEYMEGKLKRAVPYGSAYAKGLLAAAQCLGNASTPVSAACPLPGAAPGLAVQLQQQAAQVFGDPQYDGSIAVEGKDWGLGYNLGVLWEPTASTRVGLAYRSSSKHKLKGTGDWTQPSTLPANVIAIIRNAPYDGVTGLDQNDSPASVSVRTPESVSVNGFHQLTPTLALMADLTWSRQSRLQQLRIEFDNTTPDSITAERWENTYKVSVGAQWQATPDMLLRAGYSKDRSPVPSSTRGPALPDSHRTWYAMGANFKLAPSTTVDFSLGYVKLEDAAMDTTDNGEGEQPCNCSFANVRGNYRSKATIFGVQLNHKF